jgi:hypothetical protein
VVVDVGVVVDVVVDVVDVLGLVVVVVDEHAEVAGSSVAASTSNC